MKIAYIKVADPQEVQVALGQAFSALEGSRGVRKQEWRSGENARLPPLWPGFDSRTQRHMWVEYVAGSRPCSGYPPSTKTNNANSNLIRK